MTMTTHPAPAAAIRVHIARAEHAVTECTRILLAHRALGHSPVSIGNAEHRLAEAHAAHDHWTRELADSTFRR